MMAEKKPSNGAAVFSAVMILLSLFIYYLILNEGMRYSGFSQDAMIHIGIMSALVISIILIFAGRCNLLTMVLLSGSMIAYGVGGIFDPFFINGDTATFSLILTMPFVVLTFLLLCTKGSRRYYAYKRYVRARYRVVDGKIVLTDRYKPVTKRIKVDGGIYKGEVIKLEDGYVRHGCGQFESSDFSYVGEWRDDIRDGAGAEIRDGVMYQGVWANGLKNGWFSLEYRDTVRRGFFEDDQEVGQWITVGKDEALRQEQPATGFSDGSPASTDEWISMIERKARKYDIPMEISEDDDDYTVILLTVLESDRLDSVLNRYSVKMPDVPDGVEYGVSLVHFKKKETENCMTMVVRGGKDGLGIVPEFFQSEAFKEMQGHGMEAGTAFGGSVNWMYPCSGFFDDENFEHIMADQVQIIAIVDEFYRSRGL